MFFEHADRVIGLFERYVVVQESLLALSTQRVADAKEAEDRMAIVREREAKAQETMSTRPLEFSGKVSGDMHNRVTRED